MDDDKKAAFLLNLTKHALDHVATTVNHPAPDGAMSHDKKLAFVEKIAKHGLQHFDAGGTVLSGPGGTGAAGSTTVNNGGLTGTVSNALGLNNQFQGQSANIQNGTNVGQLNTAYQGVQSALGQQQNLANTVNPGVSQGVNAESVLSQQLANQATGNGPNPAQAALNQSTGQNIAQQAALAAGQRGAGANAGLIAAQNAQQGAAIQQQAVGQAATLQAQQQLAAQQQQAALAATQVNQGQSAIGANTAAQQGEQGILQNANAASNNANVTMQSNINNVNSATAEGNQKQANTTLGGIGNAVSGLAGGIGNLFAHGGVAKSHPHLHAIHKMYYGGTPEVLSNGGTAVARSKNEIAKKSGDSYSNDKIPAMLSQGELVIDRDTMADQGPIGQMARALKMHMAQRGKK